MTKVIIFYLYLTFFILLLSCSSNLYLGKNANYLLVSKSKYEKETQLSNNDITNSLKFYYVLNNSIPKGIDFKKVILEAKDENEKISAAISEMVFSKKINYETELKSKESDSERFILGLYFFSKKDYLKANQILKGLNILEYHYFYEFLCADIAYEISKENSNFEQKIAIYQKLMDKTDDKIIKELINKRIKIIRYED